METSCCTALSGSMVPSEFSVSKAQKAKLMALAVFTIPSGFSRILGISMGSMFVYSKVHPYIPVCECTFFFNAKCQYFCSVQNEKNNAKRKQFFPMQCKKEGIEDQESIQSSTTPDPGYQCQFFIYSNIKFIPICLYVNALFSMQICFLNAKSHYFSKNKNAIFFSMQNANIFLNAKCHYSQCKMPFFLLNSKCRNFFLNANPKCLFSFLLQNIFEPVHETISLIVYYIL